MAQLVIHSDNLEEISLLERILEKMKIRFEFKSDTENDFVLTEEMKKMLDERLAEDKSTYVDAFESLEKISAKYGL
ncbi:MAG: hypothetical protein QM564_01165 [Bergeyella sp.]